MQRAHSTTRAQPRAAGVQAIAGAHHVRRTLITVATQHRTLAGALAIYGSFNTACAVAGSACVLFGDRRASGSGLPELVTLLNGVEVPGFLTPRTFAFKTVGAVLVVAASLPLGYQARARRPVAVSNCAIVARRLALETAH